MTLEPGDIIFDRPTPGKGSDRSPGGRFGWTIKVERRRRADQPRSWMKHEISREHFMKTGSSTSGKHQGTSKRWSPIGIPRRAVTTNPNAAGEGAGRLQRET